jgi:hypothetical protein
MRRLWQSIILVIATLYLTGCQPAAISASLDNPVAPIAEESLSSGPSVEKASTEEITESQRVTDECTSCHSDEARLIDTAKPEEESAESESSGVG